MRSLVTGGAGFLGSHLCDRLIAAGHHVIAVDNLHTGSLDNLAHLRGRSFEFIRHDIVDPIDVEADWIFNLACPASPVHYQADPIKTIKTSLLGTLHMLELAERRRARLLQASTSEVYGDPLEHPQKEDYWGNVNPTGVRACYDEGKRAAETLVMDFHRRRNVDTRMVRIFNTYGPRMAAGDGRVISNFVVQALRGQALTLYGNGTQTRCFCYVDDMIDGFAALMQYEGADAAEPVNIGSCDERSMAEVVEALSGILGRKLETRRLPLPADDPQRRRPDCTRARRRLGWEPKVPLTEGLRRTVDYFRSVPQRGDGP
jgi:UDP-glucuronate decarboxylase